MTPSSGLIQIEECFDESGRVALPPGATLISLIDRNIANVPDVAAYRYLDYSGADARTVELTWSELGVRLRAIAARVQAVSDRGDRVAILAPQGLDYVAGFFAAIKAGAIAVPLFAPELPGHAERLDTALRDARPSAILTTTAALPAVTEFLSAHPDLGTPQVVAIDEVPDDEGAAFTSVHLDVDDVSHLQYTSGATRPPVGVEGGGRVLGRAAAAGAGEGAGGHSGISVTLHSTVTRTSTWVRHDRLSS